MKNRYLAILIATLTLSNIAHAAPLQSIIIDGQQAKNIFAALSGPAVKEEGAAGHVYRQGKNVLCNYINADISNSKGNVLAKDDVRRYTCAIRFDNNGVVE